MVIIEFTSVDIDFRTCYSVWTLIFGVWHAIVVVIILTARLWVYLRIWIGVWTLIFRVHKTVFVAVDFTPLCIDFRSSWRRLTHIFGVRYSVSIRIDLTSVWLDLHTFRSIWTFVLGVEHSVVVVISKEILTRYSRCSCSRLFFLLFTLAVLCNIASALCSAKGVCKSYQQIEVAVKSCRVVFEHIECFGFKCPSFCK